MIADSMRPSDALVRVREGFTTKDTNYTKGTARRGRNETGWRSSGCTPGALAPSKMLLGVLGALAREDPDSRTGELTLAEAQRSQRMDENKT